MAAPYKVLVTGASGFVASWIVFTLLQRGHRVRGTVRNAKRGEYLINLFKDYGDKFEYVLVEDITKDGVFDDVCDGVDAVVHTASPFHFDADDPQELILPAVKGTTSILQSVLKFGPAVKRVVITSSSITTISKFFSAYDSSVPDPFTEKDWNTESIHIIREMGRDAPQVHKYGASKALAERAAWEFIERNKGDINWDLITLQPPFVFGPVIHEVATPSALNTSNAEFLAVLRNARPQFAAGLAESAGSFVDVRDVAWAHVEALFTAAAATKNGCGALDEGQGRIILSAGEFTWQDVLDAIDASESVLPPQTARGEAGAGRQVVHPVRMDSRRARDTLKMQFRSITETFVDTLESFRREGWVC